VAGYRLRLLEATMTEKPTLIMIQFLAWVADRPRNYTQTMEAWRSSCPRLSVWEDAIIEGLIRIDSNPDRSVRLTPRGSAVLVEAQPQTSARSEMLPSAAANDTGTCAKIPGKILGKIPTVAHAAAF
jgi:hypothetical protein